MFGKNVRYIFIFSLFTIFHYSIFAQYNNPADKYVNAYKQFENADCPLEKDNIKHFVYFARDRESIHDHPFLQVKRFEGAQIMYSWRQLEPQKNNYNFKVIRADIDYLKKFDKKLFIQLQDATFNVEYHAVPDYLQSPAYNGGEIRQINDEGVSEGWVAKRWNKNVQKRFALLLHELAKNFDGVIEGINLQETAIGVNSKTDPNFSPQNYAIAIKTNMLALKEAFSNSTCMQYANFMPGEWLPHEDKGYLRSIYHYGEITGVGLGAPDLMFLRKGQLNHTIALMHENKYSVPLGIAVQDGNYIGKTGADKDYNEKSGNKKPELKNIIPLLHAFAKDFMHINYMFWVNQAPYFNEYVIPCFSEK